MRDIGFRRLGTRLTVPFVVVVLFLATAGSWIVTRQSFGTLEERQVATLSEGLTRARVEAAALEDRAVGVAASVETVPGVLEALRGGTPVPSGDLAGLLLPSGLDALVVATPGDGSGPVAAGLADLGRNGAVDSASLETVLSSEPVASVLGGKSDPLGDKFAGTTPAGLVTAAPVRDSDGRVLAAAAVLTRPATAVAALRQSSGLDAAVFDADGAVLASTYASPSGGKEDSAGPLDLAADEVADATSRVLRREWQGGAYTIGAIPWRVRGADRGHIAVSVPSSPVTVAVDATRTQVILLFGVGLLAVVGIGLLFTQRVSKSVRRLRDGADAVASGDFSSRIDMAGRDELSELATAFNEMAGRLAGYREEQDDVIAQLRSLDAAKTELIANVSHELRTPLTPIKGAASMLRRDDLDTGTRGQLVELITSNADRLLSQVNRLIVVGSATAHRSETPATTIDAARVSVDAAECVPGAGERLRVSVPGNPVAIRCEESTLRQIVHELVDNALKFTDGPVHLNVGTDGDGAMIEVVDGGPGMSAEELEDSFVAFKQGDGSSTRRHGGLGLGLTVARELARGASGDVSLISDKGGGTVATVTFPLSGDGAEGAGAEPRSGYFVSR